MTESDLQHLISQRYAAPAYATLAHVRNQTGFRRRTRTADAIAMSLYPSRGLDLMGFEIKVDRGDWKRELDDPAKAEEILQYCDRWWVVVSDAAIVQPGELPPTWGLLAAQKSKLVCKVEAPKLTPKPMERHILAGLLRNVTERYVSRASVAPERDAHGKTMYELGVKHGERSGGRAVKELRALEETVAQFERAAGVKIYSYNAGEIGKAVQALQAMDAMGFDRIGEMAEAVAQQARAAAAEMRARQEGVPA